MLGLEGSILAAELMGATAVGVDGRLAVAEAPRWQPHLATLKDQQDDQHTEGLEARLGSLDTSQGTKSR